MYPQLFVVTVPQHKYFGNNFLRHKFNQCLEIVAGMHKEMKVLRLKRRWTYEDLTLVSNEGRISEEGMLAYWASIDDALQFWETGKKKNFYDSGTSFVKKVFKSHNRSFSGGNFSKSLRGCRSSSGQHRNRDRDDSEDHKDRYHWEAGERTLPKPPKICHS